MVKYGSDAWTWGDRKTRVAVATQLIKKFSVLYGTRKFITLFTTAHHWSLS